MIALFFGYIFAIYWNESFKNATDDVRASRFKILGETGSHGLYGVRVIARDCTSSGKIGNIDKSSFFSSPTSRFLCLFCTLSPKDSTRQTNFQRYSDKLPNAAPNDESCGV